MKRNKLIEIILIAAIAAIIVWLILSNPILQAWPGANAPVLTK